MGDYLTKGTTYADGNIVNAANLNAHVDDAVFKYTAINSRADVAAPGGAVEFLINDASALKKLSLTNLSTAVLAGIIDALPVGSVLQTIYTANGNSGNLAGVIPVDDTVPLSTEGDSIGFINITPRSTSNHVLFRYQCYAAASNSDEFITTAVFRGTTCIIAETIQGYNGTNPTVKVALEVRDSPASVAAQTYTVRMGVTGGIYRLNGFSNGRKFGGVSGATFVAHEIKG